MREAAFVLCTCRKGRPSAIRTTENPSAFTAASALGRRLGHGDGGQCRTAALKGPRQRFDGRQDLGSDLGLLEREVESRARIHPPAHERGIGRRQRPVPLGRHRVLVRLGQEDTPDQFARRGAARGDDLAVVAALG